MLNDWLLTSSASVVFSSVTHDTIRAQIMTTQNSTVKIQNDMTNYEANTRCQHTTQHEMIANNVWNHSCSKVRILHNYADRPNC